MCKSLGWRQKVGSSGALSASKDRHLAGRDGGKKRGGAGRGDVLDRGGFLVNAEGGVKYREEKVTIQSHRDSDGGGLRGRSLRGL